MCADTYRAGEPCGALTHIRHAETEALGAALGITGLQVIETLLTQITVRAHHIHLRTERDTRRELQP